MQEKQKTDMIIRAPGSNITGQENSQCLSLCYAKVKEQSSILKDFVKILKCTVIFPFKMLKWEKA